MLPRNFSGSIINSSISQNNHYQFNTCFICIEIPHCLHVIGCKFANSEKKEEKPQETISKDFRILEAHIINYAIGIGVKITL